ncbi:hypothetical protein D9611_006978 [Ephemerocybe angulata]|uniref:Uncharacterized protein n=1 Tax=Ephemerocybe angulata TaxID=980116 RepID=A0A8H5EW24_9AGAR|nr:hypothetical protein D9611_006978 [Tulosesus angulatus]
MSFSTTSNSPHAIHTTMTTPRRAFGAHWSHTLELGANWPKWNQASSASGYGHLPRLPPPPVLLLIALSMTYNPALQAVHLHRSADISGAQFPYFGAGRKLTYMESSILSFGVWATSQRSPATNAFLFAFTEHD